jgi:NAD(P)H dehydrogenase (quinone)
VNTLVVFAHPRRDSFCGALFDTAVAALQRAGHEVRTLDLYAEGYRPAMTEAEWHGYRANVPCPDEVTRAHIDDLRWARQLVFVYPTWWSGLPAMLKGWLEKTMVAGVAFDFDDRGKIRGVADIEGVVGISTYGSPAWLVRGTGDAGRRILVRALALSCRRPIRMRRRWLALYGMDAIDDRARRAFLTEVDHALSAPPRRLGPIRVR